MGFVSFRARFRDRRGDDEAIVETDGCEYRLHVRGRTLSGGWAFDILSLEDAGAPGEPPVDVDANGWLTAGEVDFTTALTLIVDGTAQPAQLRIRQNLDPAAWGAEGALELSLNGDGIALTVSCHEPELEGGFTALTRQLPANVALACCFNCRLGDYDFRGNNLSGLLCYRDERERFLTASSKAQLAEVHPTEHVQEFFLCPAWEGSA